MHTHTMLAIAITTLGLGACANLPQATRLVGVAAIGGPLAYAHVTIRDSKGSLAFTQTDNKGSYRLDASHLTPPLVATAAEPGNPNCRYNHTPRAVCMVAWRATLEDGDNTTNINPLTDWLASGMATSLQFIGPQQFAEAPRTPDVPASVQARVLQQLRSGFGAALARSGVVDMAGFDPVTTPMVADGRGVDAVLTVLNHTRGYDNDSGEASATVITDTAWRPVIHPFGDRANEPLQLERAQREHAAIRSARTRVFIVGDSTAATYERERLPRMGWGQVFEEQFKDTADVKVVNGARAGRSSRDFYNGGWYRQMLRYLRPGDYVVIALGHNDQNCNSLRPVRGAADVANLCTYPNDAQGRRQFPVGQPQMSFQTALEVYVNDARARGAIPFLMTPTTRYLNADRKTAHVNGDTRPVVSQHLTRQNAVGGYAFTGDYSQTIRDTARANEVPLIDLEAKTIRFANAHAHDWQDHWLVVADTVKFPWYATQTAGTPAAPDTTHFQEAGARAMAALVAQGIKETPQLQALAQHLK